MGICFQKPESVEPYDYPQAYEYDEETSQYKYQYNNNYTTPVTRGPGKSVSVWPDAADAEGYQVEQRAQAVGKNTSPNKLNTPHITRMYSDLEHSTEYMVKNGLRDKPADITSFPSYSQIDKTKGGKLAPINQKYNIMKQGVAEADQVYYGKSDNYTYDGPSNSIGPDIPLKTVKLESSAMMSASLQQPRGSYDLDETQKTYALSLFDSTPMSEVKYSVNKDNLDVRKPGPLPAQLEYTRENPLTKLEDNHVYDPLPPASTVKRSQLSTPEPVSAGKKKTRRKVRKRKTHAASESNERSSKKIQEQNDVPEDQESYYYVYNKTTVYRSKGDVTVLSGGECEVEYNDDDKNVEALLQTYKSSTSIAGLNKHLKETIGKKIEEIKNSLALVAGVSLADKGTTETSRRKSRRRRRRSSARRPSVDTSDGRISVESKNGQGFDARRSLLINLASSPGLAYPGQSPSAAQQLLSSPSQNIINSALHRQSLAEQVLAHQQMVQAQQSQVMNMQAQQLQQAYYGNPNMQQLMVNLQYNPQVQQQALASPMAGQQLMTPWKSPSQALIDAVASNARISQQALTAPISYALLPTAPMQHVLPACTPYLQQNPSVTSNLLIRGSYAGIGMQPVTAQITGLPNQGYLVDPLQILYHTYPTTNTDKADELDKLIKQNAQLVSLARSMGIPISDLIKKHGKQREESRRRSSERRRSYRERSNSRAEKDNETEPVYDKDRSHSKGSNRRRKSQDISRE